MTRIHCSYSANNNDHMQCIFVYYDFFRLYDQAAARSIEFKLLPNMVDEVSCIIL